MAGAWIKWVQDKQFIGVDSTNHGIVISSPGDNCIGVKPSDLLLLALGACSAFNVPDILRRKGQTLTGLEVHVTGENQENPPWTFQHFHLHYIVKGKGLSEEAVAEAIRISEEDFCSVAVTLKLGVPVTHSHEVVEAG